MNRQSIRPRVMGAVTALIIGAVLAAGTSPLAANAADPNVVPINWAGFTAGQPTDADSVRLRTILRNANEYALTTWWSTAKDFDSQSAQTYLNFGGTAEANIRPSAGEALALAISIKTGAYDATATGVSLTDATNAALKLIRSLAYRHQVNNAGGWGNDWQTALWAGYAGMAGWMMSDSLSATDREYVRKMVEFEANRFITTPPPYWNTAGGDSKGEENSWNAMVLQVATAMMPNHINFAGWMDRELQYMISAYARPGDAASSTVINGKPLTSWIPAGSYNINSDGTMINHNIVHPDYMATVAQNINAALTSGLAGVATPQAALFNANVVYDGLVERNFVAGSTPYPQAPSVNSPGGTIYTTGGNSIFYPNGNDWGTDRRMQFAAVDAMASAFGFDDLVANKGSYWEPFHAQRVLDMQARFTDGHTYGATSEDTYSGREEWVALLAAQAWLTKWVVKQGAFTVTNASYMPTGTTSATVNDNNAAITYTGVWDYRSSPGRIGVDEHNGNVAATYAQLTFTGTSVTWIGTKFTNRGIADVYLDGVYQTSVDSYTNGTVYQVPLFAKAGLSAGSHTIKIVVTGTKNAAATDALVPIDAIAYGGTVNDSSPLITFTGVWDYRSSPGRIGLDEHNGNVANTYAQLTFTGTSVTWIGTKYSNRGIADVYLDGVYQSSVDSYASSAIYQVPLFAKAGLSAGSHTLKIVVTGTKNPAATDALVPIDAIG